MTKSDKIFILNIVFLYVGATLAVALAKNLQQRKFRATARGAPTQEIDIAKGFIKEDMEIISNVKDGVLYVKLSGDIDHHSAKNVRDSVDSLIRKNNPAELELDLSAVEFMDSSGLGLVLGRYKKQTDIGGSLKIINPTKRVMQILQLAGVEKIIKIERIR